MAIRIKPALRVNTVWSCSVFVLIRGEVQICILTRKRNRQGTSQFPAVLEQLEAMTREGMQLLARTVGRLPADFRAAFLLRVEEGLSFRQIAAVLETSEQTARWRVFKARQKLLKVLAPLLDREKS